MNVEIKVRFLKGAMAPQAVYHTHCECCGPHFDGWQETYFFEGQEINPDERYEQVDLRALKLGKDYEIIEFKPDAPTTDIW